MDFGPNLAKGKVSIIVPIYNAEKWLYDCLESIAQQSYPDIEVLMVDDGSKDQSASICQTFANQDKRFHYFYQKNAGVSAARNNALSKAKGEYVVFVDADDMIEPHFLENLLSLSEDGTFAVCGYSRDYKKLTEKGTKQTRYEVKTFIHHVIYESIEHPNICMMLFKNSIIQMQHLDFTVGCVRNEDTEFYMKYLIYEKEVVVSDYKGYYYRDNENSAVHVFNEKSLTFIEADQRISDFLVSKGVIEQNNTIVAASVQYFIYRTSTQANLNLYERIHEIYPVRSLMKEMCHFPRLSRKGVAWLYLILGRRLFYFTFSKLKRYSL